MTISSEDDPTQSQSDDDDRSGEEARPVPAATPQGDLVAPPATRFRPANEDDLAHQSFMVENDRSAVRLRVAGGSVAKHKGDAAFIGGVMQAAARVLKKSAERFRDSASVISYPQLRQLSFGNSVDLFFEISPGEVVQMDTEDRRSSPTIEAARVLSQMLASEPSELLPAALILGPEAASAYKSLLKEIGDDDVTFEWQVVEADDVAVLSSVNARQDFAILDRDGEREEQILEVAGRLTMADAELRTFKLTLPTGAPKPPLLKGKHKVSGHFSEDMGAELQRSGLWNIDVMASIKMERDVPGTTATPKDPVYQLLEAEPLPAEAADPGLF